MSEIVGSAVVTIRANTDGLAKDIETQVKKSVGSIDGKSIGSTLANSIGNPFSKSLTDTVSSGAKSAGASVEKELTSKFSNIGTAVKKAESDSKSGFNGISTGAKSLGDSITSSFGTIAAAAAIAFSFTKVKQFFGQTINAGAALQKQLEANNILFGSSTASVVKFAEGAAQSLGITEAQALSATRGFGALLRGLQISQPAAAEMSDRLVQLAGDIANFKGVDVETVTKALQTGITGQTRGLKQLGISLDANAIKQEALDLGLINSKVKLTASQRTEAIKQEAINEGLLKSGDTLTTAIRAQVETQLALKGGLDTSTAAITPAIKAQAIYSLILKQTGLEQGFFGKTTNDLANQQKILTAEWTNTKAALGKDLLPAAVNVVSFLAKSFLPQVVNLADALGGPLNAAFTLAGDSFKAIVKAFTSSGAFFLVGASISSIATNLSKITPAISKITQASLPVFVKLFASLASVGRSTVTLILTGINSIAQSFSTLIPIVGNKLASAFTAITPLLSDTADLITAFFNAATRAIDSLVTSIQNVGNSKDIISGLASEIEKFTGLKDNSPLIDNLASRLDNLKASLQPVTDGISNFAGILGGGLETSIKDLTGLFQGFADNGVQGLTDAFAKLQPQLQPINDLLEKQRDVIIPIAAAISGFITTIVSISTVGAILSTIGTIASSTATIITGLTVGVEGFSIGAGIAAGLVVAAIAAIAAIFVIAFLKIQPFHDAVLAVVATIRDTAVKQFENFKAGIEILSDKFTTIGAEISKFAKTVADAFQALPDKANQLANATIKALTPLNDWINANLVSTLKAAAGFFSALFDRILDIIEPAAKVVLVLLKLLASVVSDILGVAFKIVVPIVKDFGLVLLDLIDTVVKVALPLFEGAFKGIEIVVRTVFESIKAIIEGALQIIRGIFEVGQGILQGDFGKIWEGLVDIVTGPFHAIRGVIDAAFTGFVDLVKALGPKIAEAAKNLFLGVLNAAIDLITGLPGILDAAFHAVIDLIKELPGQIAKAAVGIFDALTSRGPFSELKRLVTEAFDGVISFIVTLPSRIALAAKDLFKGIIIIFIGLPVVFTILLIKAFSAIIDFLVNTAPGLIETAAKDIFQGIKDTISGLKDFFFVELPKAFLIIIGAIAIFATDTLPSAVASLWDSLKDTVIALFTGDDGLPARVIRGFGVIAQAIIDAPGNFAAGIAVLWSGLVDSASSAVDSVENFFLNTLPDKINGALGSIVSAGASLGSALLSGLLSGLDGAVDATEGFIKAIGDGLIDFVNNAIIHNINDALHIKFTIPVVGTTVDVDPPDIPNIPKLAAGGIGLSKVGGTLAQIAEAGSNEAIIPLNGQGVSFMAATIEAALRSISSSKGPQATSLAGLNTSPLIGQMTVVGNEPIETSRQVVKRLKDIQNTVVRR